MNWQPVPRIEQGGQYASHGDPYAMQPGVVAPQVISAGLSTEEQHFLSSCTTREYEEMARRKSEHMESAEHIAPQHNYPIPGKTSRLTEKVLREHFHLPLSEVAKKFGMCTTAFKKLCRKQGVMQWPHRTLRSLEKKIASLRAEQKFTNDHNQIDEQVRKLQMKREAILSGTGLANLDGDDLITSPSDDSSSTAASGSSSPRSHSQGPHDVLNALALDDSSSVGSSSSLSEDRHGGSSASSTGSLTARREGGSREAAEYPQMPGEGMLGSEKRGQWDKRAFHMASGGRGHEEEESQMSRDPFDTLSHVHDPADEMMHRMRGGMSMARGRMHGHEGAVPEDLAHQHEAHRRVAPGPMGFNPSGGLGMHPADAMHMGGRRYPSGMGMHAGGMGGHMMWYKDQHRGMPLRDGGGHPHPGAEGGFYMGGGAGGMSGGDHAASSARLQQQVNYLLAENHNLRMVIRSMSQEREEFSRKSEGVGVEIANYRVRCAQLEAELHMMHQHRSEGMGGQAGSGGEASKEQQQQRRQNEQQLHAEQQKADSREGQDRAMLKREGQEMEGDSMQQEIGSEAHGEMGGDGF